MVKKSNICKEFKVPKNCCYIRFGSHKDYNNSVSGLINARGELMVIDYDKKGRVIGIELLGSKSCRKRCQELVGYMG